MYAVQGVEYDAPAELREWQCVRVEPKRCSTFLTLPGLWPLPKHLKRVRKTADGQVLVLAAPVGEDVSALVAASGYDEQRVECVVVPWRAPVVKEQLAEWNARWPCQYLEVIPDTEPLSPVLAEACTAWMGRLMAESNNGRIGCAIVNWTTRECVATAFQGGAEAGFDGHAPMRAIAAVGEANVKSGSGQLFCTGFVAIVTHEPCVMCSMALLHARIATVVFGTRCKLGGLAGAIRIGSHPSMNHHYNVYGGCGVKEGAPECNCV